MEEINILNEACEYSEPTYYKAGCIGCNCGANVNDVTVTPDLLMGNIEQREIEHQKASVRAKVEHIFCIVKKFLNYRRTRYREFEKQIQKRHHCSKCN